VEPFVEEVDLVIRDCTVLSMDTTGVLREALIATKGDAIVHVGPEVKAPRLEARRSIDGHGKVALPGLVNCHTHLPMTLFRGVAEDQPLRTWLTDTIWPLEKRLRPDDVHVGALLGCLELIKTGTTTFADMYFHEAHVAKAVETAGVRGVLSQAVIETDAETDDKMFDDSTAFVQHYKNYANDRVVPSFGPHAVYSCSPELLLKVREKANELDAAIHIHLAESSEMAKQIKKDHALTEVQLLERLGFLDSDVLAAHCIHLSKEDIGILAPHRVKVAYNPVANMKLAQGTPRIQDLLNKGTTVGIGTDGPASNNSLDMFQTMKIAALLQKQRYRDPRVLPAPAVVRMATIEGARALGLDRFIGSLEAGKKADIILVDFDKPHLTPLHDLYANLVYSACGSDVDTVIVDGAVLMEKRNVRTLDERAILEKADETSHDLLKR
jgi:5-methylthioadenosine/S-adenosylhomocysteine deaminase